MNSSHVSKLQNTKLPQTHLTLNRMNYKISYMKTKLLSLLMMLVIGTSFLQGQTVEKYTLSGHIKDASTGEELISATLFVKELKIGNVSNLYGYYSTTLPKGNYTVTFSYVGYEDQTISIDLNSDTRKDIEMSSSQNMISEVTVLGEKKDENLTSTEMSSVNLDVEVVKKLPALFGEVDIIKAIQLLPGVKSIGEGTSGFYVRGGNADQNLVLLDEAPIYNSSHLLGFFSSFNPDAIKDMQLYKGAISSRYGGRLSSVLDIRMKEGNSKKFKGAAGIGTLMSRLALEAPIRDKGSFIVSGRRSYLDIVAKAYLAAKDGESQDFTFYFYDLNAKGNYRINENNRLFVSGYFGRDVIADPVSGFKISWGNRTSTIRWNHIFTPRLFSNLTFYYSEYDYGLGIIDGISDIDWKANLEEISGKADFTYYATPKHTMQFGAQSIRHDLRPGNITFLENDELLFDYNIDKARSIENAIYVEDELEINDQLKINIGLRGSSLHNVGPQTHVNMDENFVTTDTSKYDKGIYNSYFNFEPRLALKFSLSKKHSIKASYNRTAQYIQQASNGNAATPFDVWFTSSPLVKPQLADQIAVGYFRNFNDNMFKFSGEIYYKNFINSIDFKERAQLLLNKNLEGELRVGIARAYGLELMLKKDIGKLTGWLSYTYSKIEKKIEQINENDWYNAKYDKPHDLSLVLSYEINERLSLSGNFVYSTGSAVTFPTGRYTYNGTTIPVYSERNGERLPDYHRMDCALTLKNKLYKRKNPSKLKRFKSEWVFSVYNLYNRKNAFVVNFRQEENSNETYAEQSAIFSLVPAVTYNVKF